MRDIVEIYEHWQAGRGLTAIARSLGVDRKTVRKYVNAALAAGITREHTLDKQQWRTFVERQFPKALDRAARAPWFVQLEPHEARIREGLACNRMVTVWQRLRQDTGLSVSVATFRRYVHTVMPEALERVAKVSVWRPEVEPGEEAQLDFGYMGRWQQPLSGKNLKVWAFVMVLSYSRHMFVRLVTKLDSLTWLECHIRAFEFFGGAPRRLVLDNVASGVVKPDIYDPQFNRAYEQLAGHYRTLIDPCRAGHPKDKPRVERQIGYVRESLWRGRSFTGVEHMQQQAERWCIETAGQRIHGTTHRKPVELFWERESQALLALPRQAWEPATWTQAKVAPDAHCSVAGALYSVPWRYQGKSLSVRLAAKTVEFFYEDELVKTHVRRYDHGRQTDPADLPADAIAFYQRTPQWCLKQAKQIGAETFEAVRQLLAVDTLTYLRQAQGVLRLADRFGARRLEAACSRALRFGDPRYRTIKNILAKALDQIDLDSTENRGCAGNAYLRGSQAFLISDPDDARQE